MGSDRTRWSRHRLGIWTICIAAAVSLLGTLSIGTLLTGAEANGAVLYGYGSSNTGTIAASGAHDAAPEAAVTGSFSITGHVKGLFPGDSTPLVLTVSNPQTVAITVTSIVTTVSNATKRCLAGNVTVTAFSGSLRVRAGNRAKATVAVSMAHAAGNVCQKSRFPFQYVGRATAK